jgi:predicted DNA-binding transcriptional regulator YafY
MLSRINSLEETQVKFKRPKNFNARKILRKNFGIFSDDKTEEVVLEFSPRVKRLVMERDWRKMEKREESAGGGVRLTLKAAITPDLIAWIAGFLDDCRIVAPLTLREEVAMRMALAGLAAQRPWTPHVTMARDAAGTTPPQMLPPLAWPVRDVALVWSRPREGYEVLQIYS